MYSLRGQKEELSWLISKSPNPRRLIKRYNHTVNDILESPYVPKTLNAEWGPKLLVDEKKAVLWKRFPIKDMTDTELRWSIRNHTYRETRRISDGTIARRGQSHKGWEDRVKEMMAALQRRQNTKGQ